MLYCVNFSPACCWLEIGVGVVPTACVARTGVEKTGATTVRAALLLAVLFFLLETGVLCATRLGLYVLRSLPLQYCLKALVGVGAGALPTEKVGVQGGGGGGVGPATLVWRAGAGC